jgi:hypothetical protein
VKPVTCDEYATGARDLCLAEEIEFTCRSRAAGPKTAAAAGRARIACILAGVAAPVRSGTHRMRPSTKGYDACRVTSGLVRSCRPSL